MATMRSSGANLYLMLRPHNLYRHHYYYYYFYYYYYYHHLGNRLQDVGKTLSLTRRPPFTPQDDSWYSFLLETGSTHRAISAAGRIRSIAKIYLIGTSTRDHTACNIVPP
jgi:hypothetical protein